MPTTTATKTKRKLKTAVDNKFNIVLGLGIEVISISKTYKEFKVLQRLFPENHYHCEK